MEVVTLKRSSSERYRLKWRGSSWYNTMKTTSVYPMMNRPPRSPRAWYVNKAIVGTWEIRVRSFYRRNVIEQTRFNNQAFQDAFFGSQTDS